MKQVGAFEAKTHFSELLAAVVLGERFVITRHGKEVAVLRPYKVGERYETENPAKGAIRAIKKMRQGLKLGKNLLIKEMRAERRK